MLLAHPLLRRARNRAAPPGLGVLEEAALIPDPDSDVLLVVQDDANRRAGPAAALGPPPRLLPGERDAVAVEGMGDGVQALTVRILTENTAHDGGLARLDDEPCGRRPRVPCAGVLDWRCAIPEDPAPRAPAAGHAADEAAVSFLPEIIQIEFVDKALDGQLHLGALLGGRDAVTDPDEFDPVPRQNLIRLGSAEIRQSVHRPRPRAWLEVGRPAS